MNWTGINPLPSQRYRIQRGTYLVSLGTQSFLPGLSQVNRGNCYLLTSFVSEILSANTRHQLFWETKPTKRQSVIVDLQNSRYSELGVFPLLSKEFCVNEWIYGRIPQALYHLYSVELVGFFYFCQWYLKSGEKRRLVWGFPQEESKEKPILLLNWSLTLVKFLLPC